MQIRMLISLFFVSIQCALAQTDDCKLKKSDDGIFVYACKSESEKFKSLKAEFTINNTTIDQLAAFLKNVDNYPNWQYNMVTAKILKKESEEVMITRSEINAPWPVENRELIVQYQIKANDTGDMLSIIAQTIPTDYPLNKELVRVPFSLANWQVKKSGVNLVVNYTMRIDPGGSVPAWIVNMALAEGPYHTFLNLKKALETKN